MLVRPTKQGLPDERLHLLAVRNVLDEAEVKYFFRNVPEETSVTTLLLVAFSRWRVERYFQDWKQDIDLDAWEGRPYLGLKRHLILSSVSYLFLARMRIKLRGKNLELTIYQVHEAVPALVLSWWLNGRASAALLDHVAATIQYRQQRNTQARQSHTKRTRKKLREKGIKSYVAAGDRHCAVVLGSVRKR